MENQDETSLSKKQKPSFVAQHILSIVEDCFSQVEFAVTLPVGSASVHVDQPLSETLQAHRILEERFVNLQDVKQESEEEQSRMSTKAGSKGKGKLRREIKKSITDILRLFKPHIGILSSLRTEQGVELSWSESLLIRELNIYQSLVVKRLTSEHEWPMQNMLDLNLKEEEEVAATLKQVNVEVSHQHIHQSGITFSFAFLLLIFWGLQALAVDFSHVLLFTFQFSQLSEEINNTQCYLDLEEETINQPVAQASDTKPTSSQDEIDQLNIHLYNLMHANKQAEMMLRKVCLKFKCH